MKKNELIKEIQKKLSSGYKVLDFIHHNHTLIISVDDSRVCIEFEKIRETIKNQLSSIKFNFNNEITGKKEEYILGNIVKATINENNSLDLSYNFKRTNR